MAIPAILIREELHERRREDRWRVRLGARWLDSGPIAQSFTILDLSTSGFCLETDQLLKVGSCLIVEIPGEVTKICKTVWSSGKLHGAKFSEPLIETELQNLIAPSSVAWPSITGEPPAASMAQPAAPSPGTFYGPGIEDDEQRSVASRLMVFVGASTAFSALVGVGFWFAFV